MNNLPRSACWKAEDAKAILATEATEGDESIFLATHSPITDFDISGTHGGDIESPTEQALLDTLSSPSTKHAFCVVEGEPGSGKSHLIRWLHIKWPIEGDLILLIQRADGSLENTLRQLQHKLPLEHQHLFDSIGPRQDITLSGRARVFHTNLAHSLRIDFFENPLPDAGWCDKWDLANLLGKAELLDAWKAPERILNILSGKKGERNQELARFNLNDIVELESVLRPLNLGSTKAVRFGRMLQKEVAGIQKLSKETKSDAGSHEELRKDFENSSLLVDALNLRRNSAIQSLLGMSSEGLKTLFMRLRRELKDRRLVLLLEDITAWEGVDNQLVDVLVTNVDTREDNDLCPMVSVVGIAPEYLRTAGFRANYRQRITHYIRLGHESTAHQYQDVSSLRTPDSQIAFAAKYLRAVRAGLDTLSTRDHYSNPVPNTCDSCTSRNDCLETFGEFQGVGLFPFNEKAITTLYSALDDPGHQSTYQTPRGMIQGVLSPTLSHPTLLDTCEYPGKEIETVLIPEENRRLSGLAPAIIQAKATGDNERDRLRRLVAYWGSDEKSSTQADDSNSLTFFAIRQGIYYAFGLPWLGGKEAEAPALSPEEPSPEVEEIVADDSKDELRKKVSTGSTGTSARPRKAMTVSRAELRKLANDITAWMEGKKPANPSELNRISFEIVTQLPWQRLGICDWLRYKIFTPDNVILKGTKTTRLQNFVIPEEQWAQLGLEAYASLKTARSELEPQEEETYQRRYASMVRHLKKIVKTHVQNRLSSVHDDKEWSIAETLTQVLLARAWLRGAVSPLAPSWQQWQTVLKEEDSPTSNPNDRVDSWSEAVNKTSGSHGKLREMLRRWVALTQVESFTQGISDPGDVIKAVNELRETFKLSPFPNEVRDTTQLAELFILARDAREIHQRLPAIPKFERDRLLRLGDSINTTLRRSSIREHIGRVDKIVKETQTQLPTAAPLAVNDWIKTYQRFKELGYTNASDTPGQLVESFIDNLSEVNQPPSDDPAAILDWALNTPASEIKTTYDGLNQGETVIQNLLRYVEDFLSDLPSGVDSLDELHKIGDSLNTTSTLVLNELRGGTDE